MEGEKEEGLAGAGQVSLMEGEKEEGLAGAGQLSLMEEEEEEGLTDVGQLNLMEEEKEEGLASAGQISLMEEEKEEGLAGAGHGHGSGEGRAIGVAPAAAESGAALAGVIRGRGRDQGATRPTPKNDIGNKKTKKNGSISMDGSQVQYEAKSARDGAWYDVDAFVSSRMSESGEQEVMVKFSGFGVEEAEWVNARTCVRRRSFRFRASECELVKLWHHVLCYKETEQSGLYFDAQVHGRKVKAHGPEECDCTFLVRYEHDQSEEIVRLRKLCGRPETYELSK
ncbi:hypothetical protein SETIT_1G029300v2 [Setaria italica]|uniref:SAWADEE domain-containing protein n=1 Tax=Setaria italica TaxID=4555 RepID=A0A368PIB6_SETIT|nr:hypothetical protein SETIT_1G029300v2 [Setaria italica]